MIEIPLLEFLKGSLLLLCLPLIQIPLLQLVLLLISPLEVLESLALRLVELFPPEVVL